MFTGPGLTPAPESLEAVEWSGLGLRQAEGFGRFAVNLHGGTGQSDLTRSQVLPMPPRRPAGSVPDVAATLVDDVTRAERLEEARRRGLLHAGRFGAPRSTSVAGLLVHLARVAIGLAGFGEAMRFVETLREPARDALMACRRLPEYDGGGEGGDVEATLLNQLRRVLNVSVAQEGGASRLEGVEIVPADAAGTAGCRRDFGLPELPQSIDHLLRERQVYLLALAGELRRKAKR